MAWRQKIVPKNRNTKPLVVKRRRVDWRVWMGWKERIFCWVRVLALGRLDSSIGKLV